MTSIIGIVCAAFAVRGVTVVLITIPITPNIGTVQPSPDLVTVELVENIVAKMARIPAKSVSASDRDALRTLERDLKLTIFGQDQAIEALASAIKAIRCNGSDVI